jgi:hypothetical protein
MSGIEIGQFKYIDGHSSLGLQTIPVTLVAYPTNLTFYHRENESPLFSILWENFNGVSEGRTDKRGWAFTGSNIFKLIPIVDSTNHADPYYIGLWIKYWDEEIRRDQQVFFSTFSEENAEELSREIMFYRDSYFRSIGHHGKPQER